MRFSAKVEGADSLEKALRQLPSSTTRRNVIVKELMDVSRPLVETAAGFARRSARSKPHAADTVHAATLKRTRRYEAGIVIGPSKEGWYLWLIEHGTSKMQAWPWLRPAFDLLSDEVLARFADGIGDRIAKTVKRIAKRAQAKGAA